MTGLVFHSERKDRGILLGIYRKKILAKKDQLKGTKPFLHIYIIVITLVFLVLHGCTLKSKVAYVPPQDILPRDGMSLHSIENALLLQQHYQKWRGTPYRNGGMSVTGIDCSGFTVLAYSELFGMSLPRTAAEQAASGRKVARTALQTGDLVFFNIGRSTKHVGIYLANDQFIHASRSKGVTLSSLDEFYWQKNFWQARRVRAPTTRQGRS